MRANGFDLVSSMLMAILLLAACCVLVLFSFWITGSELIPEKDRYYPTTKLTAGSSLSTASFEFELPTSEETVALEEPSLQQIVQQVELVDVASFASGASNLVGQGTVTSDNDGVDQRDVPGQLENVIPRYERWHLVFKAPNESAYGKQLDELKIELAAFGGGIPGIDYAGKFSTSVQTYRNDDPSTEKRLYFSWTTASLQTSSPLPRFERSLLTQAGVAVAGRDLIKFLPADLENQLAAMELEYALSHGVTTVTKIGTTVFESQPVGSSYRFAITDQRYRDSR
ncbi:MAG: hypothetical protein WBD20_14275 [Pirellulaceae bacterium]